MEVDSLKIFEISKFNYLLELVDGELKEYIFGLLYIFEGYKEVKKIFEMIFGKDIKVYKVLIKDLEVLLKIISVYKIKEIYEFYI